MKLTRAMLVQTGACGDQMELYSEVYPNGAEITEQFCSSEGNRFDWNWVAEHFLPPADLEEYRRVRAQARVDFLRVKVPAYEECERTKALATEESVKVAARMEYKRARAEAWAKYERALGAAFGRLA